MANSERPRPPRLTRRVLPLGVLATVRARLLLLLGLAIVPLFAMSAWVAWQNGEMVAARAGERAALVRAVAVAGHLALIRDLAELLTALAARSDLLQAPPEACDQALARMPGLASGRYANIGLLDAQGNLRCSAVGMPPGALRGSLAMAGATWYAAARRSGAVAIGPLTRGPVTGRLVLIAGLPMQTGGGMAVAGLSVEWLAERQRATGLQDGSTVWLIDNDGQPVPVAGAQPQTLPPPGRLAALIGGGGVQTGPARDGEPYAYAEATLAEGLHLLVATPAAADRAEAAGTIWRRVVQLLVLLGVGGAAVAWGAKVAVVDPLRQLTRAVSRWRGGSAFDPGVLAGMPQEVRDLSASFSQATATLAEQQQQLCRALEQQDLLMQEIHHRVKNNLQIIASLLNLQASRIRQPEARAEFRAAGDRIRALATLHRHLYAQGDLHAINMRSFLHELCSQLLPAVGEPGRISVTIEAPELQISSDQAVPLALIVTEAVSNAAKYAFPGGRRGHIQVHLSTGGDVAGEPGEEQARLVIEDDGVGIPDGPSGSGTGAREGIGLQLIRGFARQLGASLTISRDGGTRYELVLPLRRTRLEPVDETAEAEG